MELVLVAAIADNRVIGATIDGKQGIPWSIPEDLIRFARLTKDHPVIMGRSTWHTLKPKFQPLPQRTNIVLTHDTAFHPQRVHVAQTLEEALHIAGQHLPEDQRAYCMGGSQVYAQALPYATRLELTHVHQNPEGNVLFPEINFERDWKRTSTEAHGEYTFATYIRPTAEKRL